MQDTSFTSRIAYLCGAAVLLSISGARAQGIQYDKIEFSTEQLAPHVYALTGSPGTDAGHPEGAGGRVGVLIGPDGILVVDASYLPAAPKLENAIRKLDRGKFRFLINTHEHPDHTGGDPYFAKLGATIFAREEVRRDLLITPPPAVLAVIGSAASFTDPARLPTVTYGGGSANQIHFDGETVDVIPVAQAHTDGDTIVRFETADVMMIGDFYRNYGYPFVDRQHGGSFQGVLDALDLTLKLSGPNTKLVPGHGSIVTRADIGPYRDMIVDVRTKVSRMIAAGAALPDVLAAHLTEAYDARVPGALAPLPPGVPGTSADRFVGALYQELKASKN